MNATADETFKPVDFGNVHVGDRVQFVTANNGFGSSGDDLWRTGTVTKVTDKTVTVEITGANPLAQDVFAGGKSRKLGRTARLRQADWRYRCVSKAVTDQSTRRPYNAENVQYVDQGNIVTAVWCSDPTVPPETALENDLRSLTGDVPYEVEVIGEATRYYRTEGADFSGWIISRGSDYSTEPIKRKPNALEQLRHWVEGYFTR